MVGAVADAIAKSNEAIRRGGETIRALEEEVLLLGVLVRADRILEEHEVTDLAVKLAHPHVDDMDFLPTAIAIEEVVIFKFDFELLPLAGLLERTVAASADQRLFHHLDVPSEVFSHSGIFDEFVKLVGLVFAINRGDLDLPLGSACSTRQPELGEPSHTPTPVNLVLKITNPDSVRDELVGEHLVIELEFLPLFEGPREFFGQDALPLDLLLGGTVVNRDTGQDIDGRGEVVVSGEGLLFQGGGFTKVEIRALALAHFNQVLLVERGGTIEHRVNQGAVFTGALVGVLDRFVDRAGRIDVVDAHLRSLSVFVEAEDFERG